MIQFNLLPDVKLEYIKARRTKRLVIMSSGIVMSISVMLAVVLFIGTSIVQRRHLDHVRDDIAEHSKRLKEEQDLNKVLTVQHQLNTLNPLHEAKPATERLAGFLSQTTPPAITISDLTVDFSVNSIKISGGAAQFKFINQFIDTLKFTNYKTGDESGLAFHDVVLTAFTRNDESPEAPATYEINLTYEPTIFDNTKEKVELQVPAGITTRSNTERPNPLFQSQSEGQGGQ